MFQILKTEVSYGQQHDSKAIESKKECVTKEVEEGGQAFFQANNVKLTEPKLSFCGNFTSFQSVPISHTKPATTR